VLNEDVDERRNTYMLQWHIIRLVELGLPCLMALTCAFAQSSEPANVGQRAALRGMLTPYAAAVNVDDPWRAARNSLYDGRSGERAVSDASSVGPPLYPQSFERLERIPLSLATAVVTGKPTHSATYLSNDKTTLYSEFNFNVQSVLLGDLAAPNLGLGSTIVIERAGGVIQLPSGRRLMRGCRSESMPRQAAQYLMLLKYVMKANAYVIVSGFELSGNRVYVLEDVVRPSRGPEVLGSFGLTADQFVQSVTALISQRK
jgi:hypothetical protein